MARNPSRSGQSPINPLYPGYYPGRRMPFKPRPRGPKPTHFTGFGAGDSFSEFVDSISDEVEGTLRGPDRWVRERMADDFSQGFKVYGESPSELPNQALDDYESGSVPGGGFISLNLDPREWLGIGKKGKKWMNEDGTINRDKKAPRKMLEKTLKDWAKSALNFQDLETKARTDFWEQAASSRWDFTQHSALENAAYKFATGAKENDNPQPENPLALDNIGVVRYRFGDKPETVVNPAGTSSFAARTFGDDLYKTLGGRFKDFNRHAETPLNRDKKLDRYQSGSLDAFTEEAKYAISLQPGRSNEYVESFLYRSDFAYSLGRLGFTHSSTAGNLSKIDNAGLNRLHLVGTGGLDLGVIKNLENIDKGVTGLRDKLLDPKLGLREKLIKKHGVDFVDDLETYVSNMEDLIKSKSFQNVVGAGAMAEKVTELAPDVRAQLSSDLRNVLRGLNSSPGVKGLLKGRSVTGGDVLMKSLERQMLYDLNGEIVSDGHIRKLIEGEHLDLFFLPKDDPKHRDFFTANGTLDPDAPLRGGLKLLTYTPLTSFVRDIEATEEVITQLRKEQYLETYGWRRIERWLGRNGSFLSARGMVDKALERVNKFGLVLGNDAEMQKKGWDVSNSKEPGRFFGNRFSIDAKVEKNGKQTATEIKTYGGKHYNSKHIEEHKNWMISAYGEKDAKGNFLPHPSPFITKQHIDDLFINKKKLVHQWILEKNFPVEQSLRVTGDAVSGWKAQFMIGKGVYADVFTKEFAGLNLLEGCKDVEEVKERIKQIINRQKGIDEFVEHLHKVIIPQFKAAGIDVTDSKFLYDYIIQLDHMKELQKADQRYLGVLQKIGINLTKFQDFLYKIPVVGGIANQVAAIKTMFRVGMQRMTKAIEKVIKETIQRVVAKVSAEVGKLAAKEGLKTIVAAVMQSLAFLGDTIAPLIAHAIAWVITKLVILVSKIIFGAIKGAFKFGQRVLKGELMEYLEEAEKKMDKNARRLMYIIIILVLINAIFSPLIGLLIPDGMIPGGILTTDPFSDGVPFTLSTFSPTDPTRRWGSIQQNFDWNINLGFQQIGGGGAGGGVGIGDGTVVSTVDCFSFVDGGTCDASYCSNPTFDSWTDVDSFKLTVSDLGVGTGHYKDRLCQAGPIYVHRTDIGVYECQGRAVDSNNIIVYGNCLNRQIRLYLFAHESGHVYDHRVSGAIDGLNTVILSEGSLPTYSGGTGQCGSNNNVREDFAETVADWLYIYFTGCHVPPVSYDAFWNTYSGHKSFAQSVLFY